MAVLSRLLVGSQQRVDLADFLSIQSYVSSDFRELMRSFVGSSPVILKGFDLINASQSIGTTSVSINVAESVLYDPTSNAGSFFSGLPEGNALSQPIVLGQELRTNAVNYVYLTLTTTGAGQDTRAFWDVDLNGGAGGEFNQTINTEGVLIAQAGVSTSGFPQGTIPVAKITLGPSAITEITDCRNLMFRLGTGGTSPDPNNRFQFPALPTLAYARSEPPSSINSAALPNPFQGGDKNIQTLKEWMDAVMTKLVELSGTTYWYESTGDLSLVKVYDDALGSSLKSKGVWQHDETTIGQVTWTENILYRKMNDPRDIIIKAGSKQLQNEQVMWIKMVRNQKINALDSAVSFINGASYVNGAAGYFQYLKKGDWIKSKGDSEYHYARVVGFYTAANAGGSETPTPSAALSIKLESAYSGSSGTSSAVYTKGFFDPADSEGVRVSDRDSLEIYSAGGDMYWLANRSDTIQKVSNIETFEVTDATISDADGASAKLVFNTAPSLSTGDRVYISHGTFTTDTYEIEKLSNTEFAIKTTQTGSFTNATVRWAVVTTGARVAGASTFEIESANHGFASGQKVSIAGASTGGGGTPDVNGLYLINVRSATQFQIPYSESQYTPTVTNATATCAKVILKTDLGSVEVVQGEEVNINEPDTKNLLGFIGMDSLAEVNPNYAVPDAANNMLHGYTNYNSSASDSLTTRVSRLSAMMADRVQDREIKLSGRATFRNTTSGTDQVITVSGDSLTITKPGSLPQTVTWGSSFTLAENKALVATINRNSNSSITPTVVSYDANFLLEENKIVLFYRTTGDSVYSWDGTKISNSSSWTCNDQETSQNKNIVVNEQVSVNYDGTKLVFSTSIGDVYILVPGTTTYNKIDVSNFTSGIAILNNQSAWVRINRAVNKTFTNRQTSSTYQDSDAAGSIYVTSTGSVPTDQDVVVLYSIQSGKLIRHHSAPVERRKIYEEYFQVVTQSSGAIVLPLPLDSRNGNATPYYINGSGQLEIALNGQILRVGDDYTEYGTANQAQSQVTINTPLSAGDVLRFRLASEGGFYTIDLGTTTTLQQAYGQGRFINTAPGSPVTISASAGYKALRIEGDLDVTGVIDPTGLTFTPQASNPLSSDQGIWVDTNGNLRQARPGETVDDLNITSTIIEPPADSGLQFDSVNGKLLTKIDPANALVSSADGLGIVLNSTNPGLMIVDNSGGGGGSSDYILVNNPVGFAQQYNVSGNKKYGQAFLNDRAYDVNLSSIDLKPYRYSGSGTYPVVVEIFNVAYSAWNNWWYPTGSAIAVSDSVPFDSISTDGETIINFQFSSPVTLTANTRYAFAISFLGGSPFGEFLIFNSNDNEYTDGNEVSYNGSFWKQGEYLDPNWDVGYFKLNFGSGGLSSSYIDAKLDSTRAITSSANGLGINLETTNPGLKLTDNKLDVKLDAVRAITSGSSGLGINLETVDPTLAINGSNQLKAKLDPNGVIITGAGGLNVAVDGTSIQIQDNQLVVSGVPNLLSTFTNNTGSTIPKGTVVIADTGANTIKLFTANNFSQAIKVFGVTYEDILDTASGLVQTAGIAEVLGTVSIGGSSFLNLSTPGQVTNNEPTEYGQPIIRVGVGVSANTIALNPMFIGIVSHRYRETYTVGIGGILTDAVITIPVDSKQSGAIAKYIPGKGFLSVYLNGQLLEINEDYQEGPLVEENTIIIKQDLIEGDKLTFTIDPYNIVMMKLGNL